MPSYEIPKLLYFSSFTSNLFIILIKFIKKVVFHGGTSVEACFL